MYLLEKFGGKYELEGLCTKFFFLKRPIVLQIYWIPVVICYSLTNRIREIRCFIHVRELEYNPKF